MKIFFDVCHLFFDLFHLFVDLFVFPRGNRPSHGKLLVSTYVVCERLSVMHEPAGVVENLVQILQNTPIL